MKHHRKTLYHAVPTHSGMFPRTLQQAFGPGATWPIDRRSTAAKVLPWLAAGLIWGLLVVMWWGASA